jgi:cytochrome c-type biogenesis protein CcmH/NrfF
MATEYGLSDAGKAVRCLINYVHCPDCQGESVQSEASRLSPGRGFLLPYGTT